MSSKQPLILISSSSDLRDARRNLETSLRMGLRDMSLRITPYLWEEETENGRTIDPGTPIQKQINAMLAHRVKTTIVMFGERIGEPLSGKPPEGTTELIAAWEQHGLRHPWPDSPDERRVALEAGCFPLTGTTYELLVALKLNADENRAHGERLTLRIGYVADKAIEAETTRDSITLNQGQWFHAPNGLPPGGKEQAIWKADVYDQQIQGVLNLLKALAKSPHGSFPLRFETQNTMVDALCRLAIRDLKKAYPTESFGAVFKPDLSPFGVEDPMPFPDREALREELKSRLLADGARGQVLALRGSSGCGKSSLLQKGLLGAEPPITLDALSVVVRPTDVAGSDGPTPLLKFLGALAERLEETIGAVPGLRNPSGGRISQKIDSALDVLVKALDRNRMTLILGIDQFEEIIDYAGLDTEKQRGLPGSWWQILHFIGRAARQKRILVAVTVESQRRRRIEEMAVEDVTEIDLSYINVNFEASRVSEFVNHTAAQRGLPLSPKVAEAIERMVEAFERQRLATVRGANTSSFLPLLSLWLHRLFTKFRDRQKRPGDEGAAGSFARTAELIDMKDLAHRGIDMQLGPLISELVEDAWNEAGELERTELSVSDTDKLNTFIQIVAQRYENGNAFVASCQSSKGFDVHEFVRVLLQSGIEDIPGVTLPSLHVSDVSLENFFSGLIGVDEEGNMRLTEMPRKTDTTAQARLINAHLKRRLLEPVIATDRVRLIHQAVIDNWQPAREWYENKKAQLITARNTKQAARAAGENPDFAMLALDGELVARAACLLALKRSTWSARQEAQFDEIERETRAFCLGLVAAAPDGRLLYDLDLDGGQPIAFIAAMYDLSDPLERWLDADPDLVDITTKSGDNLLDKAAWFAPKAVDVLLSRGAPFEGGSGDWHPITAAIQSGNIGGLRALLAHYDGPETVIGPYGTSMLHMAAISPSSRSMRTLLEKKPDPNIFNENGQTPLLVAALYGKTENAALLLEGGANPVLRDKGKFNVLNCAVQSNSADVVNLIRNQVTDEDSEVLLFGEGEDDDGWLTPVKQAAALASPDALTALLDWVGDEPIHRGKTIDHPLVRALPRGQGTIPQPMADRISDCVGLLLETGSISSAVIEEALRQMPNLPDVRRRIENHMVLYAENLDTLDAGTVLACIIGDRPNIAAEALRKRPSILDHRAEDGTAASQTILRKAGPHVLLACLTEGLAPTDAPELFFFEAALGVCRNAFSEGLPVSDLGPDASKLALLFPGVDADRLHPLIREMVDAPENERTQYLLKIGSSDTIRTLLHRLAVRGDLALYTEVVEGMRLSMPLDFYGRPPSAVAPSAMRQDFESFEPSGMLKGIQ